MLDLQKLLCGCLVHIRLPIAYIIKVFKFKVANYSSRSSSLVLGENSVAIQKGQQVVSCDFFPLNDLNISLNKEGRERISVSFLRNTLRNWLLKGRFLKIV